MPPPLAPPPMKAVRWLGFQYVPMLPAPPAVTSSIAPPVSTRAEPSNNAALTCVAPPPPEPKLPPLADNQLPKLLVPPAVPGLPLLVSVVCAAPPVPPTPTVTVSVEPSEDEGSD